ncbi:MAG: DJ-1/PfpI family protein [Pseudomonadales bacterium]|nr:DJ-1/PfpI family protein [Pseudomonadales bacterium]
MKLFLLFVSITLMVCAQPSMAKDHLIGILVFDGVLTSDVTAPAEVFGAASKHAWFSNYEVVFIAVGKNKTITTEEGISINADLTIYDQAELAVLIAPSAYDMSPILDNEALIKYVQKQNTSLEWLMSHCSGSQILAEAGLLDGKKATTWAGGEKDFAKKYPKVDVQHDVNVVMHGRFITSNGSVISYQSSLLLLEQLSSKDFAQEVADAIQWPRLKKAKSYLM